MRKIQKWIIIIIGFALTWVVISDSSYAGLLEAPETYLVIAEEPTATNTPVPTATNTPVPTATNTPVPTVTNTPVPTATNTPVPTATNTPVPTATKTPLPTATKTPIPSTSTFTPVPTSTNTPIPPSPTRTPTATITMTSTPTQTPTPTNSPPSISPIDDKIIDEDKSTGFISFTIGDLETPADQLTLTASSSNTQIIPVDKITLSGTGKNRTVTVRPAANEFGSAKITIEVSDGLKETSEDFNLQVLPVNDPPTIDLNGSKPGTGYSTSYIARKEAVTVAGSDLKVRDIDNTRLQSATVTITNLLDGIAEVLKIDTSGTNLLAQYSAGVLQVTGNDTKANYQKALKTTTYINNAASPNSDPRNISFVVDDGGTINNTSLSAQSTVNIINPLIMIEKGPDTQTIASGGTAVFTIDVENIGNVPLENVKVSDPLAVNCNRSLGALAVGEKKIYTCNHEAVIIEFQNTATVEGEDTNGNNTTAIDTARVDVENPNLQIIKSPFSQTILKGGTAEFEIFVVNTSNVVDLVEVVVDDPESPDCSREGEHLFSNLFAGETFLYNCQIEDVTAAFTNVITVTGTNLLTQEVVQDSSIAQVELLDMDLFVESDPVSIPSTGGPITYTVTISNPGTIEFTLNSLNSDLLGSLLDGENSNWINNSCVNLPLPLILPGSHFSCNVSSNILSTPPSYELMITAGAVDNDDNFVTDKETIVVAVTDVLDLNIEITASQLTVPAPGSEIEEFLKITNTSYSEAIAITSLQHSSLGNLNGLGDCKTPQTILPKGSYDCHYLVDVLGRIGDSKTHTIQVSGTSTSNQIVSAAGAITINVISPNIRNILMPLVVNNYTQPEEDNDLPCSAHPINIGKTYTFLPDDENDWFYFDVVKPGNVSVLLTNFLPADGQLAVWSGESCHKLTVRNAHNANFETTKKVNFNATIGRYYVWITNFDGVSYNDPYSLLITGP